MGILSAPVGLRLVLAMVALGATRPALAQRGSLEFGGFGALASFAPRYDLRMGVAGGGRLAMSPGPGWAVELEVGSGNVTVAGGGRSVPLTLVGFHALRALEHEHGMLERGRRNDIFALTELGKEYTGLETL